MLAIGPANLPALRGEVAFEDERALPGSDEREDFSRHRSVSLALGQFGGDGGGKASELRPWGITTIRSMIVRSAHGRDLPVAQVAVVAASE